MSNENYVMTNSVYYLNHYDANIVIKCFTNSIQKPESTHKLHEIERKSFTTLSNYARKLCSEYEKEMDNNIQDCPSRIDFVFFENFLISFLPSTFKNALFEVPHIDGVCKCIDLLLDNHDCQIKNHCKIHLSLIVKFYLLMYKNIFSLPNPQKTLIRKRHTIKFNIAVILLDTIRDINGSNDLVLLCLKVFIVDYDFLIYFLIRYSSKELDTLLNLTQKVGLNVWNFCTEVLTDIFSDVSHAILLNNRFSKFKLLSEFGVINNFSPKYYNLYFTWVFDKWREYLGRMPLTKELIIFETPVRFHYRNEKLSAKELYSNIPYFMCINMRIYQIIYLYYFKEMSATYCSEDIEIVLKILWATIPDPYIVRKQFLQSCGNLAKTKEEFLTKVWNWYNELISKDSVELISPRSLKHLSRITIRKRLSSLFKLPQGVSILNCPPLLQNYLLIKECV